MITLIPDTQIELNAHYEFFLKSTRKNLSSSKFFGHNKMIKRGRNTPLMYVRAPKHFKSGKQHIFFFNGKVRKNYKITNVNNKFSLITTESLKTSLFSSSSFLSVNILPDYILKRVTVEQSATIKIFNGWGYFYTINIKRHSFFFYFLNINFFSKIFIF